MSESIYTLCALTSGACAWLTWATYRRSGHRLLFWSAMCFTGMTVNNIFLVADKLVFPSLDLSLARQVSALIALMLLLYGLIYEKE